MTLQAAINDGAVFHESSLYTNGAGPAFRNEETGATGGGVLTSAEGCLIFSGEALP